MIARLRLGISHTSFKRLCRWELCVVIVLTSFLVIWAFDKWLDGGGYPISIPRYNASVLYQPPAQYFLIPHVGPDGFIPQTSLHLPPPYPIDNPGHELTIVTAFFNLGRFHKGFSWHFTTPSNYYQWMLIFKKIQNPLIVFLEDDNDIAYFTEIRKNFENLTKIIKVSRQNMWAFGLRSRIKEIYSQPSYPKHYPNTVDPAYSCVMHAKYECMYTAVMDNPFHTKYFAWLDVGYFRQVKDVENEPVFAFSVPPSLSSEKVGFTEVYKSFGMTVTAENVFRNNMVWISGGFFIAKADVMLKWVGEYVNATEHFISNKIMNTDQQVILAMHKDPGYKPQVKIQPYRSNGKYSRWFHLGYLSKEYGYILSRKQARFQSSDPN